MEIEVSASKADQREQDASRIITYDGTFSKLATPQTINFGVLKRSDQNNHNFIIANIAIESKKSLNFCKRMNGAICFPKCICSYPQESQIFDICNIISCGSMINSIQLLGDLSVCSEGIVRMFSTLNNSSIGHFPTNCEQVSLYKDMYIINLSFASCRTPSTRQIHQAAAAIPLLSQLPESAILLELLKQHDDITKEIQQEIENLHFSPQFLESKDIQYQKFITFSFDYLKNHQPTNTSLFSYLIGRVDLKKRDYDISNAGYSVGFLELLGIDQECLTSITLRSKQIDLALNKSSLIQQTIQTLFHRNQLHSEIFCTSDIITFDGFPIRIFQHVNKIAIPEEFSSCLIVRDEYLLVITEIDVNCVDLRKLIQYREQFISKDNNNSQQILPLETLIQKELSYKFEDVEYSIFAEQFIQKYYQQNVQDLKEIEKSNEQEKQCKFRFIDR